MKKYENWIPEYDSEGNIISEEYPCYCCQNVLINSCELCNECSKDNNYFGTDLEGPGGWMVQDGRTCS